MRSNRVRPAGWTSADAAGLPIFPGLARYDEVKRGAESEVRQSGAEILIRPDRRDAILEAVGLAASGDVVLIAGKGHERYQEIGGQTFSFDDVEVAREALTSRRLKSRAV